jgi:uncharacterized protein YkwD
MKNVTSVRFQFQKKIASVFLFLILIIIPLSAGSASSNIQLVRVQGTELPPPPKATPQSRTTNKSRKNPLLDNKITTLESELGLYLPLIYKSSPFLDTQNRQVVKNFYLNEYLGSEGIASGWDGNVSTCNPGTTSDEFKNAVAQRINYFRAMAGVPNNVTLDPIYNYKAQAAALMMSANGTLSHNPPSSWKCYTADGDEAAGSSNLAMGMYGPGAISGYMSDTGSNNTAVGHRRWILYPQTQKMGTGDVISGWGWNSLWVFDNDNIWGARPETREAFVAWPPPGFVPVQVVYSRWSFSYARAGFSSSTVSMNCSGTDIPLTVYSIQNGYGENTIVWEPSQYFSPETNCIVNINNVIINDTPQNFQYEITIFDASVQ